MNETISSPFELSNSKSSSEYSSGHEKVQRLLSKFRPLVTEILIGESPDASDNSCKLNSFSSSYVGKIFKNNI